MKERYLLIVDQGNDTFKVREFDNLEDAYYAKIKTPNSQIAKVIQPKVTE